MELIIFSALEGLQAEAELLRDLAILAPSRLDQVQRLLSGERPPEAIYLDDTRPITLPELWRTISLAREAGVAVFVNVCGSARSALDELRSTGIAATSESDPTLIVAWLAERLGVHRGATGRAVPMVAVGAAKGGIGKTFATCVLAEGLRRRGLRVLVWDGDISNPGLVPAFRIPSSAPSYLHLIQRGPAHWNAGGIKPFIYQPDQTRPNTAGWGAIDFLIGSHSVARAENDVRLPDWQGFYQGVSTLEGYDLVLIDTPPDYLRRPYATHTLQCGGTVVLPCPPGARERMGVGHMLDHFRDHAPDKLDHCTLLFMEPERGVTVRVADVRALFTRRYPQVQALGALPRDPRLASRADEHDGYVAMLDLGPHSSFAIASHQVVDALCTRLSLRPQLPLPKVGLFQRLNARFRPDHSSIVSNQPATSA